VDITHADESAWVLSEEEILSLEQMGTTLRRDGGHVFMREGEASDFILLIKKGYVKVVTGQPSRIIAFRGPRETVGELGVLDNEPRSATVIAWGDVEVLHVSATELLTFLDQHRRAEQALHVATRKRLAQATRKISDSDLVMERRLAKELVKMVQNGLVEADEDVPTIGLSQKDLASLIGASVVAVKKIVRIFKNNDYISTERFRLRITDFEALRRIADGKPSSSW
jgi:CRP-like cAMP-binding protein